MSASLSARAPRFAALVRNDRGGLEVRRFHTSADAASATADREHRTDAMPDGLPSHVLAKQLGLHPKTVRRRWQAGEIPGIEHGPRTLVIPHRACRLIKIHGLLGYARLQQAGKL